MAFTITSAIDCPVRSTRAETAERWGLLKTNIRLPLSSPFVPLRSTSCVASTSTRQQQRQDRSRTLLLPCGLLGKEFESKEAGTSNCDGAMVINLNTTAKCITLRSELRLRDETQQHMGHMILNGPGTGRGKGNGRRRLQQSQQKDSGRQVEQNELRPAADDTVVLDSHCTLERNYITPFTPPST